LEEERKNEPFGALPLLTDELDCEEYDKNHEINLLIVGNCLRGRSRREQ
jgi:hypothetical protein